MTTQSQYINTNKRIKTTHHTNTSIITDIQLLSELLSWPTQLDQLMQHKSLYDTTFNELLTQLHTGHNQLCSNFNTIQYYQQFFTQLHYSNILAELIQKYTNISSRINYNNHAIYRLQSINAHSTYEYMYYVELYSNTIQTQSQVQRGDIVQIQCMNDINTSRFVYIDSIYVKQQQPTYIKGLITLQSDVDDDMKLLQQLRQHINELFCVNDIDINCISYLREYNALVSIDGIRINNILTSPVQPHPTDYTNDMEHIWNTSFTTQYKQHIAEQLNESQLNAVKTVVYNVIKPVRDINDIYSYITAVTGPPGIYTSTLQQVHYWSPL